MIVRMIVYTALPYRLQEQSSSNRLRIFPRISPYWLLKPYPGVHRRFVDELARIFRIRTRSNSAAARGGGLRKKFKIPAITMMLGGSSLTSPLLDCSRSSTANTADNPTGQYPGGDPASQAAIARTLPLSVNPGACGELFPPAPGTDFLYQDSLCRQC